MNILSRIRLRIFHRNQRCDIQSSKCIQYPVAFLTVENFEGDSQDPKICTSCIKELLTKQVESEKAVQLSMNKVERERIGAIIKTYRERKGMSKEELARLTNTSLGNINLIEAGAILPNRFLTHRIEIALRAELRELSDLNTVPALACASLEEVVV